MQRSWRARDEILHRRPVMTSSPTMPDMPVVALHGFTQTARSWVSLAVGLNRPVIAPDLPGHGDCAAERPADLFAAAALIRARVGPPGSVVSAARPAVWIGYSLGGRVLLHLALAHPETVAGIILVSTTAGIDDQTEREARRASDSALADRIEQVGVHVFVDEWLAQPLFALLTVPPSERIDRCRNTAAGLAHSLRSCGTGSQAPLWSRLSEIIVPTLIVSGTEDTKFEALGQRLASSIPSSTHHRMSGAGHSCAAEQPVRFAELVARFIATL